MQTYRDIEFANGEYRFQLCMDQIIALEEELGQRIGAIHRHLLLGRYARENVEFGYNLEGDYGAKEIMAICRLALIGGKRGIVDGREVPMSDGTALRLVRTYLHPDAGNPLQKAWDLATSIVQACVIGYEAPEEAKKKAPPKRTRQKAVSTEPRSSATA